ncbi:uncharacterized protein LOC127718400 [Mytilus californianus]|uniref:uncharacterized protein LOC127718400 n=1 Tax=Mytilus californianus TaxID=6549 RepID=UPI002247098D|nr:uncharacterized protein LOC127718400 [Mytilus californianus]
MIQQPGPADLAKMALNSNEGHYVPRRGIRINKCDYIMDTETIPEGYVPLSEGHQIYVLVRWLTATQSSFTGKTKSFYFKLMVNGFFQPHEVVGMTGGQLSETPLGQASKAYALSKLSMDSKDVIFALNAKIATMTRAVRTKRAPEARPEDQ